MNLKREIKKLTTLWSEICFIKNEEISHHFCVTEQWTYKNPPYWTVRCFETEEYSVQCAFKTYNEALEYLHKELHKLIKKDYFWAREIVKDKSKRKSWESDFKYVEMWEKVYDKIEQFKFPMYLSTPKIEIREGLMADCWKYKHFYWYLWTTSLKKYALLQMKNLHTDETIKSKIIWLFPVLRDEVNNMVHTRNTPNLNYLCNEMIEKERRQV